MAQQQTVFYEQPFQGAMPAGFTLSRILSDSRGGKIRKIAWSPDGGILAAAFFDKLVCLWDAQTGNIIQRLAEQGEPAYCLAWSPTLPLLAWKLDTTALLSGATHSVRRITAKIVLVGESGFGKTGLGWRLAHGEFKEHASTHGQQFWILDQLHTRLGDGAECEAMLWDFAGQPDYRLIHTLFLDDVDLALVLFNPTDWQEPLRGVDYWLKALSQRQEHPCRTILVGARTDRGEFTLTAAEIEAFCRDRDITGGYVATSALTGEGLEALIERMKQQIDWPSLPVTTTTDSYEHIKKQLLLLKESVTSTQILIDFTRLQHELQTVYPWQFSETEVAEAVCQLEKHGYVRMLRTVLGERRILLAPELLNNLAASCVLEARRHSQGLGALDENRLLNGDYSFPELIGLDAEERNSLLAEVAALLLDKNICFRQSDEAGTALIFPELINRRQTSTEPLSFEDDVSYTLSGPIDNVYAALTVLLGYTCILIRSDQWQHQVQYESKPGEVFGVRQLQEREGDIDLVLYFNDSVNLSDRRLFRGLFERFAIGLNVAITRYPPLICAQCGYPQERAEIVRRTREGYDFVFCSNCGRKNILLKAGKELLNQEQANLLDRQQAIARQRTLFEAVLTRLKAFVISQSVKVPSPNCLIIYTRDRNERWVTRSFAQDLKNAGIKIVLNTLSEDTDNTAAFQELIEFIESNDPIIIVGTEALPEDYQQTLARPGRPSTAKLSLVNLRLFTEEKKKTVIPILREGDAANSLPSLLQNSEYVDLRHEKTYFANLFDLILSLYGISFARAEISDLQEALQVESDAT